MKQAENETRMKKKHVKLVCFNLSVYCLVEKLCKQNEFSYFAKQYEQFDRIHTAKFSKSYSKMLLYSGGHTIASLTSHEFLKFCLNN